MVSQSVTMIRYSQICIEGGALGPRKDVYFLGNQAKRNEKLCGEGEGMLLRKNGLTSFMQYVWLLNKLT